MDENRTAEQSRSFGQAAGEYERARPGYPDAAVDWLVAPVLTGAAQTTVLDLGAGTGKFTRALVERGLTVIAVEPDDVMRATLAGALPGVRAIAGTAESIPLPDNSVDAVTLAQAWHWVDVPKATAEIARVLKPGGTLGLVWNIRDESVDWVHNLSDVVGQSDAERFIDGVIEIPAPFGPVESFFTDWQNPMDVESLVTLIASRSYIITASEEQRSATLSAVRALAASDPALAGRTSFEMPYRTFCFRTQLHA